MSMLLPKVMTETERHVIHERNKTAGACVGKHGRFKQDERKKNENENEQEGQKAV